MPHVRPLNTLVSRKEFFCPYLNPGFAERRACRQPFSCAHTRIMRFVEFFFQLFELLRTECRTVTAKFWLFTIEATRVFTLHICNRTRIKTLFFIRISLSACNCFLSHPYNQSNLYLHLFSSKNLTYKF